VRCVRAVQDRLPILASAGPSRRPRPHRIRRGCSWRARTRRPGTARTRSPDTTAAGTPLPVPVPGTSGKNCGAGPRTARASTSMPRKILRSRSVTWHLAMIASNTSSVGGWYPDSALAITSRLTWIATASGPARREGHPGAARQPVARSAARLSDCVIAATDHHQQRKKGHRRASSPGRGTGAGVPLRAPGEHARGTGLCFPGDVHPGGPGGLRRRRAHGDCVTSDGSSDRHKADGRALLASTTPARGDLLLAMLRGHPGPR
jgi:hypothetical protein